MSSRMPKLPPARPLDEEQRRMFEALSQDTEMIEHFRYKDPPRVYGKSESRVKEQGASRPPNPKGRLKTETSALYCTSCSADPTMSREAAEKAYRPSELTAHLKGEEHTRREQLRRAFKNDILRSTANESSCPLCRRTFEDNDKFLAHVEEDHPLELWPEEDDVEKTLEEAGDEMVLDKL